MWGLRLDCWNTRPRCQKEVLMISEVVSLKVALSYKFWAQPSLDSPSFNSILWGRHCCNRFSSRYTYSTLKPLLNLFRGKLPLHHCKSSQNIRLFYIYRERDSITCPMGCKPEAKQRITDCSTREAVLWNCFLKKPREQNRKGSKIQEQS